MIQGVLKVFLMVSLFLSAVPVLAAEKVKVYDKADWHLEGEWPEGLPEEQSFVHIGYYLGWLIDRSHTSAEFNKDFEKDIARFKKGELTAPKLLKITDGVLTSDMIDAEGNLFTKYYFEDLYLEDYERLFPKVDSLYEVKDNRENYAVVKERIDSRFTEWKNSKK